MRKSLIGLIVATALLAGGVVLVAGLNLRAARGLADRALEARAVDRAAELARRLGAEQPRTREALQAILEDGVGDDVAYVVLSARNGEPLVSAGEAPAADAALLRAVRGRSGEAARRFVSRRVEAGGEELVEFVVAVGLGGRNPRRPALARVWAGLGEELGLRGSGTGPGGPPILRLGLRPAAFDSHVRRAQLVLLLAVVLAPLIVGAALLVARAARRAAALEADAARRTHLASLGELAATVAHEIRNPLASMKGYLQLVEEGTDPDTARRAAATLREECGRIERTVEQVLGYAREAQPRLERVDLRAVVDGELARRAEAAAARGVGFLRDYGDAPVEARVDRDQFARLVANLLDNALAVSPENGRVTLGLEASRREVELRVADQGPGVPDGDRERIFEPFFTRRAGGTGLGLAVVRRIAEAHGGAVRVEAGAGRGAVFRVTLPREPA